MFKYFLVFVSILFLYAPTALASNVDGTIDSSLKYVWGDELGWINFGTTGGDVHVTDVGLTGYAWSSNFGWINLAPTGAGVLNDGEGDLSGFAWGENIGYIDFEEVSINSSGRFGGTASSSLGVINFDCANCGIQTDWVPASLRPSPKIISYTPEFAANIITVLKSQVAELIDALVGLVMDIKGGKGFAIVSTIPEPVPGKVVSPPIITTSTPTSTINTSSSTLPPIVPPLPISPPVATTTNIEDPGLEEVTQKPGFWGRFMGFIKALLGFDS